MVQNGEQKAAIIIVGNEILNGSVHDSNSYFLCRELFDLGVRVQKIITIPDDEAIIADEIQSCRDRFDLCFVAGGVGPTHDDVTIAGISRGLNLDIVVNEDLTTMIRNYFGDKAEEAWLKMALVPEGAELVTGENVVFPVLKIGNIYIFPGIPSILENKFTGIREEFRCSPYCKKAIELKTSEAKLVPLLNKVVHQFPDVEIGSYPLSPPQAGIVRLTLSSKIQDRLEDAYLFLNSLLKLAHFV